MCEEGEGIDLSWCGIGEQDTEPTPGPWRVEEQRRMLVERCDDCKERMER